MKFSKRSKTNSNHRNTGFTLVEMIVSLGVLSIVLVIVSTFFAMSIRAQRAVLIEKSIAENINFAIEFMSRQMRTAQRYEEKDGQPDGCIDENTTFTSDVTQPIEDEIKFINQYQQCVEFALVANSDGVGYIQMTRHAEDNPSDPSEVRVMQLTTPTDINIERMDFFIRGERDDDNEQPRVTLVIEATGLRGPAETTVMRVQTSVVTRGLDTP